jgi:hypothetical protein
MPSSSPRWVITLREAIKREHGLGWSAREMGGRIQLTGRFDDGTRSSVTLDRPWSPASTTSALRQIKELRERMESTGLSIKEGQQLVSSPVARAEGRIDGELAMQRFEKYKVLDSGDVRPSTFQRLYGPVLDQVQEVVPSGTASGRRSPRRAGSSRCTPVAMTLPCGLPSSMA